MSAGQMIDDVRLACGTSTGIRFLGRTGGNVPRWEATLDALREMIATR